MQTKSNFHKRKVSVFLIGMILAITSIVSTASVALADSGTVYARKGTNFRTEPNGARIKSLPQGTSFEILASEDDWFHIELPDGKKGYVWANAVEVEETTEAGPIPMDRPDFLATRPTESLAHGNENDGGASENAALKETDDGNDDSAEDGTLPASTNGTVCHECEEKAAALLIEQKAAAAAIAEAAASSRDDSEQISCLKRILLENAKKVVKSRFGNRSRSAGQCALAVRRILDSTGFNNGAGLGHAINYHTGGILAARGFVNRIEDYPTVSKAPAGAILVFKGPKTEDYIRNGKMSEPYGNYVGHVTVKGDDGKFYTDGRTADAAVANRTLVGVYVIQNLSKVPNKARNKCD